MTQRLGVAGAPTPRGVPFIGFPFGLLRRFPVPILRVDPGLITPDQPTTFTASSLTPGTPYSLVINYVSAASLIVAEINVTADFAGTVSQVLNPADVLGKAAWDPGIYFVLLIQKPTAAIGVLAFIVQP